MDSRITQLRSKELIDISSGSRYGYVGDLEIDLESGQVRALVVPGRLRLFGLLGRERERVFPWTAVRCFGEDTILVDGSKQEPDRVRRRK
jgi:YlmC/YmxH family sporulation protein